MNKFITTIALVALATVTFATAASAGPGNGNGNQQMGGQQGPQININLGGGIKGNGGGGGGYASGDSTSPGDAFYPDRGSVGDPTVACLADGGTPVRRLIDADFYWVCI
jgi:hypothetical protein